MANYDYMEIKKVISDKKEFLELLLLTDEQEDMIDRYLDRGDMFVLYDNGLRAACVVTREGENFFTDNYDHPIYEEVNYPYIGVRKKNVSLYYRIDRRAYQCTFICSIRLFYSYNWMLCY